MPTPALSRDPDCLRELVDLLDGRRVVVLAGAGMSTESGIPDYRGPEGSLRARRPIQYQEFVRRPDARARYWARSAIGWPRIAAARPNPAHAALAALERVGIVRGVLTQNVDGLHQAAGSRRVLELHGALAHVRCLECGRRASRARFQARLRSLNRDWLARFDGGGRGSEPEAAPDGDAELPAGVEASFRVPECGSCGGTVKPDVVFFGENVPRERVDRAWRLYEEAEALLVVGSSLTVFSGRRFTQRAERDGVPIGIVNLGETRADHAAAARVEGRLGETLPELADRLVGR